MKPTAIDVGIPAMEYDSMTFGEIMLQVESFNRAEKKRLKEKAYFAFKEAYLNSYAFNDPSKTPKFDDVFEFAKSDEEQQALEEKKVEENKITQAPAWKVMQVEMIQKSVMAKMAKQKEALEKNNPNGGES